MKNKTLSGAILLVVGTPLTLLGGAGIAFAILPVISSQPDHREGFYAMLSLFFLFPPFLAGLLMAITGGWQIRRDRAHQKERAIWRLFGGILQAAGILVAGASGLCSISAIISPGEATFTAVLMFGGIPCTMGICLFHLGRTLCKPPASP